MFNELDKWELESVTYISYICVWINNRCMEWKAHPWSWDIYSHIPHSISPFQYLRHYSQFSFPPIIQKSPRFATSCLGRFSVKLNKISSYIFNIWSWTKMLRMCFPRKRFYFYDNCLYRECRWDENWTKLLSKIQCQTNIR